MAIAQKICVLSMKILGPHRSGGIATYMTSLAEFLAHEGADVTILYPSNRTDDLPLLLWQHRFRSRGIAFEPLYGSESPKELSYLAYQWLKERDFDSIHFPDFEGIGFWVAQAKSLGLAFRRAALVCHAVAQTLWRYETSYEFLHDTVPLEADFLEKTSIARADVLVSPSEYMLDSLRRRGWVLPEETVVLPVLQPMDIAITMSAITPAAERFEIEELVFFGPIDGRRGLTDFCAAIARLSAQEIKPGKITFLGPLGMVGEDPAAISLAEASVDWDSEIGVVTYLSTRGALTYLGSGRRLAVMPLCGANAPYTVLECLHHAIPMLVTDVGGIRELIHPEDQDLVLAPFHPAALAARLIDVLRDGGWAARPAVPYADVVTRWRDFMNILHKPAPVAAPTLVSRQPMVSVCISHFNRPAFLEQAIRSLERQTYKRIEAVIIDDASPSAEVQAYLDGLEKRISPRGWKLIRSTVEMWTGGARNEAARHASGDFVLLMDDDNVAMPHEVATFVEAAQYSGADILTCQQQPFVGSQEPPEHVAELPVGWMPVGANIPLAVFENCLGDLNMFVRRPVWQELGGFTEEYYGCEDWEFLLKAALMNYKLECIPEILFYYRVSGSNLAQRYSETKLYQSMMRILRPVFEKPDGRINLALLCGHNIRQNQLRRDGVGYWQRSSRIGPETINKIRSLPLSSPGVLSCLGELLAARQRFGSAVRLFESALAIDRTNWLAIKGLTAVDQQANLPTNKLRHFVEPFIGASPPDAEAEAAIRNMFAKAGL